MMIKKIVICLAAALLCICTSVYAEELNVEISGFTVTIKLKTEKPTDIVTAQVLDKAKTKVYGMLQQKEYTEEGGVRIYSARAELASDIPTGEYVVRAGGKGIKTQEETLRFVNENDKIAAYLAINGADKDDIYNIIKQNKEKLTVDFTDYLKITDTKILDMINEKIEALDLDADKENITETDRLFERTMRELTTLAELCLCSNEADFKKSADYAAANLAFDNTYYPQAEQGTLYKAMKDMKVGTIDTETLKKAFDSAVFLSVQGTLDYTSLGKAYLYYNSRGILKLDLTYYGGAGSDKEAELFKKLKQQTAASLQAAEEQFFTISKELSGTSGGGGGGTKRGSGSGSSLSMPAEVKPPVVEPETAEFNDIPDGHWAAESIKYLAGKQVISGDGNGSFRPEAYVTREEFVKLVVAAFELYDKAAGADFADMPAEHWCYGYAASAYRLDIVRGISEELFGTGTSITREDMAAIIYRVYTLIGKPADTAQADFYDYGQISVYAREAVCVLYNAGVIGGMEDGGFAPKAAVTRAQAAKIIYAMIKA